MQLNEMAGPPPVHYPLLRYDDQPFVRFISDEMKITLAIKRHIWQESEDVLRNIVSFDRFQSDFHQRYTQMSQETRDQLEGAVQRLHHIVRMAAEPQSIVLERYVYGTFYYDPQMVTQTYIVMLSELVSEEEAYELYIRGSIRNKFLVAMNNWDVTYVTKQ